MGSYCVGPVVDISMSSQNHEIYQLQALWVSLGLTKNLGLPCIYDSLLLIRPNCSFREGIMMKNKLGAKRKFFEEISKEESPIMGIMAQNKGLYSELNSNQILKNEILSNSLTGTALGLASALILVKAYANWLLVEVNQICYGGILRTIALGFTEGISSWKVETLCTFQPLVVPVGRSTLGRLFNVLGATIDAYVGIDELPIYSDEIVSFDQYKADHSTDTLQRVQFSGGAAFTKTIKIRTEAELQASDFLSVSNVVHIILEILTFTNKYLQQQTSGAKQTRQLESLGLVCIMGIGAEIIKTRESEVMSFSNVSSTSAQEKIKFNIIGLIEGNIKLVELMTEIKNSGIKGSVARDRNLSPIHKAP